MPAADMRAADTGGRVSVVPRQPPSTLIIDGKLNAAQSEYPIPILNSRFLDLDIRNRRRIRFSRVSGFAGDRPAAAISDGRFREIFDVLQPV